MMKIWTALEYQRILSQMMNLNTNKIIQWNCDGFYSHHEDFQLLLKEYNPYIICIQETKFKYKHKPK